MQNIIIFLILYINSTVYTYTEQNCTDFYVENGLASRCGCDRGHRIRTAVKMAGDMVLSLALQHPHCHGQLRHLDIQRWRWCKRRRWERYLDLMVIKTNKIEEDDMTNAPLIDLTTPPKSKRSPFLSSSPSQEVHEYLIDVIEDSSKTQP